MSKVKKPNACQKCSNAKPAARVTLANSQVMWMCKQCVLAQQSNQQATGGQPSFEVLDQADFSTDLEQLMASTPQPIGREIPDIVTQVIGFVESQCLFTEGIYRQSGSSANIELRKDLYNRGRQNSMMKDGAADPHAVAGLLKLWFRTLPRPLFTFELFPEFMALVDLPPRDVVPHVQRLLQRMPAPNRFVAHALFMHLRRVADCAETNLMGPENLAIVFGPNVFKKEGATPLDDLAFSTKITGLTTTLIEYALEIFSFIGPERDHARLMLPSAAVMQAASAGSGVARRGAAAAPATSLPEKGAAAKLRKQKKPQRESINF